MMKLTAHQYGLLRCSACSVCVTSHKKDPSMSLLQLNQLADLVTMLLGKQPDDELLDDVLEKAKQLDIGKEIFDSADKILELLIGPFTYEIPEKFEKSERRLRGK